MEPVLRGEPKPTLSALARELRGNKSRPEVSGADARALIQPEVVLDGQYEADLIAVFRLSANAMSFVWCVATGPCSDAILAQRVADVRDNKGLIGPGSALGRVINAITAWPETSEINVAALLGRHCLLDVRFINGRSRITIVPVTDDGPMPVRSEPDDAVPVVDTPGESVAPVEEAAPVTPEAGTRLAPETSSTRRKAFWPSAEDEEHQEPRRCRECGELLGDAPCELCIACESEIVGETE